MSRGLDAGQGRGAPGTGRSWTLGWRHIWPLIWPRFLQRTWQRRWQGWWAARHPPGASTTLVQRNVYILPTPAGWLYGLLLVALLLGSINYQLNLGHLLTFLLAGSGIVAMHATHATLRGLRLSLNLAGAVSRQGHVGDGLELPLRLVDTRRRGQLARLFFLGRHGIHLSWADAPPLAVDGPESRAGLPEAASEAAPAWTPRRRGPQAWPRLRIETRYPLGLLRAWSFWQPDGELLVWPAPEADPPPLPAWSDARREAAESAETAETADSEDPAGARPVPHLAVDLPEPDGVRPWRDGDRPSQVLWRRSARLLAQGGDLLVRDLRPPPQGRVLHWRQTADLGADTEARLSRLCAWVLTAERTGLRWALELPDRRLPEGEGPAHRIACLDALARSCPPDSSEPADPADPPKAPKAFTHGDPA